MVHVEQLSTYNYVISFRGCGPKLFSFDGQTLEEAMREDITTLMWEDIAQFKCKATCEDVSDIRYGETLGLVNANIYVVWKIDSINSVTHNIDILSDYLTRSYVKNILD